MIPAELPFKMTIRQMTLEDLADVVALDALSFNLPWPERSFRYELTQNQNASAWVSEVTAPDGSHRQIAGMIVVWLIIDEAHIGTIAVHPNYRRKGIGQKLLAHALLSCHTRGAISAFLEVRRGNLAAQALYFRFGFEVIGERRRYYHDNGEDALLMGLSKLNDDQLKLWYGG